MTRGTGRQRLIYLAVLSLAAYTNTWTLFYVLPRVHAVYDFSGQQSLLVFIVSLFCLLLATYPIGWLSDRTGRRTPFLYASLAIIGVTTILSAFASDYRAALAVAVVSGFGSGGISSAFFALLCDLTEPSIRARAAGLVDAVSLVPAALIFTLAPGLPAVPVQAALGLVPLAGLLLCLRLGPAALAAAPPQTEAPETPLPPRYPVLAGCALPFLVGMIGWGLHGELGDEPFKVGLRAVGQFEAGWLVRVLLYIGLILVGGALADRFGRIPVWTVGFLLRAGGVLLFATLAPALIWAGILLVGLGHINDGLGMMVFGEYAPRSQRARAFAAAYVAYLGASVVSLAVSSRLEPSLAGVLGAGAAVLAAVAVWPLRRWERAGYAPGIDPRAESTKPAEAG